MRPLYDEIGESVEKLEKQIMPTSDEVLTLSRSTHQLGGQAASLMPRIENLSSAFGDQMGSLRSLAPAMKQTGAMMQGMFSGFLQNTGPALTNFFGGLMSGGRGPSGKGGGMKDLLGSLKDTAIKSLTPFKEVSLAA